MKKTNTLKGRGVDVYNGNFDKALRTFRKKIQKDGLIQEVRDRKHFEKKSDKRRLAKKAARRKAQQQNRDNSKRLY